MGQDDGEELIGKTKDSATSSTVFWLGFLVKSASRYSGRMTTSTCAFSEILGSTDGIAPCVTFGKRDALGPLALFPHLADLDWVRFAIVSKQVDR